MKYFFKYLLILSLFISFKGWTQTPPTPPNEDCAPHTLELISVPGTDNQTICGVKFLRIEPIVYKFGGGADSVKVSTSSNVIMLHQIKKDTLTISGLNPNTLTEVDYSEGINYEVTTLGNDCEPVILSGTITFLPYLEQLSFNEFQEIESGNQIEEISYKFKNGLTYFDLDVTELLSKGMSINITGEKITISGTPRSSFNHLIKLKNYDCILATVNIKVNHSGEEKPRFNLPNLICQNEIDSLPKISDNNISGNWSFTEITPEDGNAVYSFIPNEGNSTEYVTIKAITVETIDLSDDFICKDAKTQSLISNKKFLIPSFGLGNDIKWYFNGTLQDETTNEYTFTAPGEYFVTVENSVTHCISVSNTAIITEVLHYDISDNQQSVCEEQEIEPIFYEFPGEASFLKIENLPEGLHTEIENNKITIWGVPKNTSTYKITSDINDCFIAEGTIKIKPAKTLFDDFGVICYNEVENLPKISKNNISGDWFLNGTNETTGNDIYNFIPDEDFCSLNQFASVEVYKNVDVFLENGSICKNANTQTIINNNTFFVSIDNLDDYSFEWYFNENLQTTTESQFTATMPGEYFVVITNKITGCIFTSNIALVTEILYYDSSYNEQTICEGQQIEPIVYEFSEETSSFTINNLPEGLNKEIENNKIRIWGAPKTSGNFTLENTNSVCGSIISSYEITITPLKTLNFNPLAPVCYNEIFELQNQSTEGISGTWLPKINNKQTTTYTFYPNDTCFKPAEMQVEIVPNIEIVLNDVTTCEETESNEKHLFSAPMNSNYTYNWYFENVLIPSENKNEYYASTQLTGNYYVEITDQITGCVFTSNVAKIEKKVYNDDFIVKTTESFEDKPNVTITSSNNLNDIFYQIDENATQKNNVFLNVSFGPHQVHIFDSKGCLNKTIPFYVSGHSKYFSPNGDGINDKWKPFADPNLKDVSAVVYDRFGKKIITINNVDEGWDGTYQGNILPSDDYWFKIFYSINGVRKEYISHFSLTR